MDKMNKYSYNNDKRKNTNMQKRYRKRNRFILFGIFHITKFDILLFLISIIGIFSYLLSLEGCEGTQVECLNKLGVSFFMKLFCYVLISSSSLAVISYYSLFKKKSSWYHLIYIIPLYISVILSDLGSSFFKHGSYNAIGFCILYIFILFLIFFIDFITTLFKKLYIKISITLLILIIVSLYYVLIKIQTPLYNCNDFYLGLGGIILSESKELDGCKMQRPSKCIMEIMNGVLDMNNIIGKKCEVRNYKKEYETFIKYIRPECKNSKKFGFPLTQQFQFEGQKGVAEFNEKVLNNVFTIDNNTNEILPQHEIELSFNNNLTGTININISQNEQLISQRTNIRKNNQNKIIYKNILFIYIDAISRRHFLRKMKHTSSFLEKHLYNISNQHTTTHKSFQYFKYNNIDSFTQINVAPMLYGESMRTGKGTNVIKYFKQKGYITGQSLNLCSREVFAVEQHYYVKKIHWEDFDHENVAMFCDTNYYDRKDPYPLTRGPFSIFRRCLYGKDTFEYVIEYAEKFWNVYADQNKFFKMGFIDAHESTGEAVKYLDKPLTDFLERMLRKGLLNDTMIWIVSDHGNNMGEFFSLIGNDFEMEKTLGSLFIMVPYGLGNSLKEQEGVDYNEIENNLHVNEQRMITPYDIHDTLVDLVFFKDPFKQRTIISKYGQSLFWKIDGLERNCQKYKFDMKKRYCRCNPW